MSFYKKCKVCGDKDAKRYGIYDTVYDIELPDLIKNLTGVQVKDFKTKSARACLICSSCVVSAMQAQQVMEKMKAAFVPVMRKRGPRGKAAPANGKLNGNDEPDAEPDAEADADTEVVSDAKPSVEPQQGWVKFGAETKASGAHTDSEPLNESLKSKRKIVERQPQQKFSLAPDTSLANDSNITLDSDDLSQDNLSKVFGNPVVHSTMSQMPSAKKPRMDNDNIIDAIKCVTCKRSFRSQLKYNRHLAICSGLEDTSMALGGNDTSLGVDDGAAAAVCIKCKQTFRSTKKLHKHSKVCGINDLNSTTVESRGKDPFVECKQCLAIFKSQKKLDKHAAVCPM